MRTYLFQGDATRIPLADESVDLIFTSPPYSDARTYGISAQRDCDEWIEWMLEVVTEMTRVCRGLVLVNCAGVTRKRNYWPGPEGLMYRWWKRGGNLWRPAYWHRVGIPGSGGKQWLRADIEYVIPFKRDAEWLPFSDNTANGHPPKWGPGGEMSHRVSNGVRVNQWGHPIDSVGTTGTLDEVTCGPARPSHRSMWGGGGTSFGRRADGQKIPPAGAGAELRAVDINNRLERGNERGGYASPMPVLANPGNLIRGINVGGGVMGSKLSHENEAPFPERLAEWFIKSWCAPEYCSRCGTDEGGSRPVAEAENPHHLSEVRVCDRQKPLCPSCGSDLTAPGAIRPGIVLDPFSGSATTVAVARRLGRRGIGMDLRWSQCELGTRRLAEPVREFKAKKTEGEAMLFDLGGASA